MKMKLYLDTSIPSAYFDYSKPIRQLITQKWFEHEAGLYELLNAKRGYSSIEIGSLELFGGAQYGNI